MYLMIQNPGVCPVEGFTVYGLSGTRDSDNPSLIGQFGSGNKHATNLLLRQGINPIIFCGHKKLCFFTKPATMTDELGNVHYNRVHLSIDGQVQDLNYSVDYGSLDWDKVSMALREYVSNAIDRTIKGFGRTQHEDFVIDIVPDTTSKGNTTRVFVPLTVDVQRFYSEIGDWFLHFKGTAEQRIMEATSDHGRIYRNGVFVRGVSKKALFFYNFDKTLKIDEARNLSDYYVRDYSMAWLLKHGTVGHFEHLFRSLIKGEETFEADFPRYISVPDSVVPTVKSAWNNVACGRVLVSNFPFIREFCERKGYRTVHIKSESWEYILSTQLGVKSYKDLLTLDELDGLLTDEPTVDMNLALDYVWNKLKNLRLTGNFVKPKILQFVKLVTAEGNTLGMYRDGIVYVNSDIAKGASDLLYSTILEELTHHITSATDVSRDFQEFLLKALVTEWRHGGKNQADDGYVQEKKISSET